MGLNRPRKARREDVATSLHHSRVSCAARGDDGNAWGRARSRRFVRGPERALERSTCGEEEGYAGEEGGNGGGDGYLRSVVERAIGVEEDGIFRRIVAFL